MGNDVRPAQHERYLVPKELSRAFIALGLECSYDYALALVRDCPKSVRRQLRLSDALRFLEQNPDYKPFARDFNHVEFRGQTGTE